MPARLFFFFLLTIIFSCKDKEEFNRPVFDTERVAVLPPAGAVFYGRISKLVGFPVLDYGFVWSTEKYPTVQDSAYYFQTPPVEGVFSAKIYNQFLVNRDYYVRAFIKSEFGITYADVLPFKIGISPWKTLMPFPGEAREQAVGFSLGSSGFIATGKAGTKLFNDVWRYSPPGDSWVRKSDFPGVARAGSFTFKVKGKVYIGGGYYDTIPGDVNSIKTLSDLWEYDLTNDRWTQKANFPSKVFSGESAMVIGSLAYVLSGLEFYVYDPSADQWTRIFMQFPGSASVWNVAFGLGSKGYIGLGGVNGSRNYQFWVYDPGSPGPIHWQRVANYVACESIGTIHFVIGGIGYAGNGDPDQTSSCTVPEFCRFDPQVGWQRVSNSPGNPIGFSAAFDIDGIGYFATGKDLNGVTQAVCSYDPMLEQ